MKKILIFAVMIGLTTSANSQTADNDSAETQSKTRVAALIKDRIYAYGQYGLSVLTKAGNSMVLAYESTDVVSTGWNAEVDWVNMESGWAPNLVTEFNYTLKVTDIEPKQSRDGIGYLRDDYGMTYNPIFAVTPKQSRKTLQINYRWSNAEIGFRSWGFNGSTALAKTLSSDPVITSENGTVTEIRIAGAFMYGQALLPVTNIETVSGRSDVYYWMGNHINLQTKEFYLAKPIAQSLDLRLGLKYINTENAQRVGQDQWAYSYFYYQFWWDNRITLDLVSKTLYEAKGPMIGLKFYNKFFKVLFVDALVQYSRLKGNAEWDARWTDIDNIQIPYIDTGALFYEVFYNGDFPYSLSTQETITAIEWHLKLRSPDFDPVKPITATFGAFSGIASRFNKASSGIFNNLARFTSRLENKSSMGLSIGWFNSGFDNVPVAAVYTFPGTWTVGNGTHWTTGKRNWDFDGISFGVSLNF